MNTNLMYIFKIALLDFQTLESHPLQINPEYDTVDILNQYANENGIVNSNWNLMTGDRKSNLQIGK